MLMIVVIILSTCNTTHQQEERDLEMVKRRLINYIVINTKRVECCQDNSGHELSYDQLEDFVKRFSKRLNYTDYTPVIWKSILHDEIDQLRYDDKRDAVIANYNDPKVKSEIFDGCRNSEWRFRCLMFPHRDALSRLVYSFVDQILQKEEVYERPSIKEFPSQDKLFKPNSTVCSHNVS